MTNQSFYRFIKGSARECVAVGGQLILVQLSGLKALLPNSRKSADSVLNVSEFAILCILSLSVFSIFLFCFERFLNRAPGAMSREMARHFWQSGDRRRGGRAIAP